MLRPALAQPTPGSVTALRPLWAWLMSILLHLILLLTLGLALGRSSRDSGAEAAGDRPISVALVQRLTERQEPQPTAPETATPSPQSAAGAASDPAAPPQTPAVSPPPDFAPPLDLAGVLAEMTAAVDPVQGSDSVAGEIDDAGLLSRSGDGESGRGDRGLQAATAGSKGTASLFGVSGSGSRFVYLVDRSDSMNRFAGRPLRVAKAELKRSLDMLTPSQSFQLVLYNERPRPYRGATMGGPVQMLRGESDTIARARRYLGSVEAFGGTNHFDALRLSLRMGPDVLFFLTDGHIPSLSKQEMADIGRLADRSGTIIHAIEFGTQPVPHRDTFVRRLAGENRGEYRYFDVSNFSDSGVWQRDAREPSSGNLPERVETRD